MTQEEVIKKLKSVGFTDNSFNDEDDIDEGDGISLGYESNKNGNFYTVWFLPTDHKEYPNITLGINDEEIQFSNVETLYDILRTTVKIDL